MYTRGKLFNIVIVYKTHLHVFAYICRFVFAYVCKCGMVLNRYLHVSYTVR